MRCIVCFSAGVVLLALFPATAQGDLAAVEAHYQGWVAARDYDSSDAYAYDQTVDGVAYAVGTWCEARIAPYTNDRAFIQTWASAITNQTWQPTTDSRAWANGTIRVLPDMRFPLGTTLMMPFGAVYVGDGSQWGGGASWHANLSTADGSTQLLEVGTGNSFGWYLGTVGETYRFQFELDAWAPDWNRDNVPDTTTLIVGAVNVIMQVPEPSTLLMLLLGPLAMALRRHRR